MAFADEIAKTNSERFMLFRVTPGRLLANKVQNGTVLNGKIFEVDAPFPEWRTDILVLNGTTQTKVSSGPPTALGEWAYNGTKVQWVEPNNPSGATWAPILFYNLFYSSGLSVITNATPGDTATPEVLWEPRLSAEPNTTQDSSKLISGFLSTTISQVRIANHDTVFQQYLTDYDSFNQKSASVWIVANGLENFQRVYSGKIRQIQMTKESVSFQLFDILSLLDQPALMGDSVTDAYYSGTGIPTEDEGKPIPYFMGPSSAWSSVDAETRYTISASNRYIDFTDDAASASATLDLGAYTKSELESEIIQQMNTASSDASADYDAEYDSSTNKWTITNGNPLNVTFSLDWNSGPNSANSLGDDIGFDLASDDTGSDSYTSDFERWWTEADRPTDMTPAVCTNFNAVRGTFRNRNWTLGRVDSAGLDTVNLDYVSNSTFSPQPLEDEDGNTVAQAYWVVGSDCNLEPGDTFVATVGLSEGTHKVVWKGDTGETFPYFGTNYNLVTNYIGVGTTSSPTLTFDEKITIVIKDENSQYWYPLPDRDYTYSIDTLASGNKIVRITLDSSLETNLGKPDPVHPNYDTVYYRLGCAANNNHADAIQLLAETSGIDVSATSFATAASALDADVQFSIPELDKLSGEIQSFRYYAELIAKSTLSVMYINTDFELAYQLLAAPSGGDTVADTAYGNLTLSVDYNDILTELDSFNLHNDSDWVKTRAISPAELRTSVESQYLHEINTSTRYRHVLRTITNRVDALFDVLKERRLLYEYDSAASDLATNIGDSLVLESPDIAGGDATKAARVVGITKNANKVKVKISDLLGL